MLSDFGEKNADGQWPCGCRLERAELAIALCPTHAERFGAFLDCKFCRTTPNASDPHVCGTEAEANQCPWNGHIREPK